MTKKRKPTPQKPKQGMFSIPKEMKLGNQPGKKSTISLSVIVI
jgi:hypothetical protein